VFVCSQVAVMRGALAPAPAKSEPKAKHEQQRSKKRERDIIPGHAPAQCRPRFEEQWR
jgi:hypothetical protein